MRGRPLRRLETDPPVSPGRQRRYDYHLYHLKDDIGESTNLASANPQKVKELDRLIERHLTDTKAVVPKPNEFDPAQYHPDWRPSRRTQDRRPTQAEEKPATPRAKDAKPVKGWRPGGTAAPLDTGSHTWCFEAPEAIHNWCC